MVLLKNVRSTQQPVSTWGVAVPVSLTDLTACGSCYPEYMLPLLVHPDVELPSLHATPDLQVNMDFPDDQHHESTLLFLSIILSVQG